MTEELRQRTPRLRDDGYLKWLRRQACVCGCTRRAPSDAAHIRAASLAHDKPQTGMGQKPDDRWALPLNHRCHMQQHEHGELAWWEMHRIDPFEKAISYYRLYRVLHPNAPEATVEKPRKIVVGRDRTVVAAAPDADTAMRLAASPFDPPMTEPSDAPPPKPKRKRGRPMKGTRPRPKQRPMPGTKASGVRKTMSGKVVKRGKKPRRSKR